MTLESVQDLGKIELERKITEKLTVKLRSLTALEYSKVMKSASISDNSAGLNALGHLASLQMVTLAYATLSINGQSDTPEAFLKFYENLQYPLVVEVYKVYVEILNTQNETIEELKKNLTSNPPVVKTT
jgi:hypothetical protein